MARLVYFRAVCALLLLACILSWQVMEGEGAPSGALITSLPGFSGTFGSKHYGGYVTVDEEHGRALYYYFVTSEGDPASDPLVLWLNGGPGCSSFDGFVYEHGPFLFQPALDSAALPTLVRNPYTWAKNASILYLDSPAGVGFSFSGSQDDYTTGDLQTANDTHAFLLKWLEEYPEFQSNSFFVSGESYGGVYVPTLTRNIADGITSGVKPVINLKGYMVGNGVTDQVFDGNAFVPFSHGMGLIPGDLYEETYHACNGSYWNGNGYSTDCIAKINQIGDLTYSLNIYDILQPCYHGASESENNNLPASFKTLGQTDRALPVRKRIFGRAWPLGMTLQEGPLPTWTSLSEASLVIVPCVDGSVATTWLNDAGVRSAIRAKPESAIGSWDLCTSKLGYYHDAGSMIPYHRSLTGDGYRALIFSGDHDFCVPFTGSEAWTSSMGYSTIDPWRPWFVSDQVAGYTRGFDHNLTFATVMGAGHTVPEYKPREALAMFQRFLLSESL